MSSSLDVVETACVLDKAKQAIVGVAHKFTRESTIR